MNTHHFHPPSLHTLVALPERPRLLIVDDQPINIQVLYRIFDSDHEVFMATSGTQAIEVCQRVLPDVILLDVLMPDMSGLDVCQQLKASADTRDIPVIFVTAQSDPIDETRALEAGGVDFISKPVNPAVVRARVHTHLTLKAQSDLLRTLVFIDDLTGVANRRCFSHALQIEWRRCRRNRTPLALLMADVDHFKLYNDHYGHPAGDQCLQMVAGVLQRSFGRSHDIVARYGGEEFVCLMPDSEIAGAQRKAEEVCAAVRAQSIPHAISPVAQVVTISIGVAAIIPIAENLPEQLLGLADVALYEAKNSGRNRVVTASV